EYLDLNRRFIWGVLLHVGEVDCILDVACGTGTLTDLLLAELRRDRSGSRRANLLSKDRQRALRIIGVDKSRESLRLAREHFLKLRGGLAEAAASQSEQPYDGVLMLFVEASGDNLPLPDTVADLV